jgi:hypothetical protein
MYVCIHSSCTNRLSFPPVHVLNTSFITICLSSCQYTSRALRAAVMSIDTDVFQLVAEVFKFDAPGGSDVVRRTVMYPRVPVAPPAPPPPPLTPEQLEDYCKLGTVTAVSAESVHVEVNLTELLAADPDHPICRTVTCKYRAQLHARLPSHKSARTGTLQNNVLDALELSQLWSCK